MFGERRADRFGRTTRQEVQIMMQEYDEEVAELEAFFACEEAE